MYARLVTPAAGTFAQQCMRDIGRLITSADPSLSDLSGAGYDSTTSLIVDNTPAGWEYIGSTSAADQPSIAGSGGALTLGANLCFRAPMRDYASLYKFAVLTHSNTAYNTNTYGRVFALTGATNATATGVLTNESYRQSSPNTTALIVGSSLSTSGSVTHHVIANARHITIIQENSGMMAVWEASMTELHQLYNRPSFVAYHHPTGSIALVAAGSTPVASADGTTNVNAVSFSVQNPGGALLGTYRCADSGNVGMLLQTIAGNRANTVNESGLPRYQVQPVFVHNHLVGQAVQYVTGIVPIYWTKAGLGSTGDNVSINDEVYTYFNCGTSALFGVLLQTS